MSVAQRRKNQAQQLVNQRRQELVSLEARQDNQLRAMEAQMASGPTSAHAFEAIRAQEHMFFRQRDEPISELEESMAQLQAVQADFEEAAREFRLKSRAAEKVKELQKRLP